MRRIRLISAGTIVMSVLASGTARGEAPGDGARCLAGAGAAYLYCTNHGYPTVDCSTDHTYTTGRCAIQYPI